MLLPNLRRRHLGNKQYPSFYTRDREFRLLVEEEVNKIEREYQASIPEEYQEKVYDPKRPRLVKKL